MINQPDLNAPVASTDPPIANPNDPVVAGGEPPEPPPQRSFSLKIVRVSIPVDLEDVKGNKVHWTLNELTGAERDEWQQGMQSRTKIDQNGKIIGGDVRGIISSLLVRCLAKADGRHPDEALLSTFPCSALDVLFEEAVIMNRLKPELSQKKND